MITLFSFPFLIDPFCFGRVLVCLGVRDLVLVDSPNPLPTSQGKYDGVPTMHARDDDTNARDVGCFHVSSQNPRYFASLKELRWRLRPAV